ncbi:MAG TPA: hypothetical protein VK483_18220 [Chitinophagaceae bacterium]|nr:hypothetical protein [Chitinophagaceae bacterium]
MKKTIGIVGVTVLSLLTISVHAQQTQTWDPKKNPTVEAIISKYELKPVTPPVELKASDIFPVIGKYESATNADAASVTVNPDQQNKGMVWIEGLPQGRVKAMLRKSPATYKIPAQKTQDGKEVAEGTLIFDKETNTLSICIGKPYNTEDPASVFLPAVEEPAVIVKTKSNKTKIKKVETPKAWIYTGTKLAQETVMN